MALELRFELGECALRFRLAAPSAINVGLGSKKGKRTCGLEFHPGRRLELRDRVGEVAVRNIRIDDQPRTRKVRFHFAHGAKLFDGSVVLSRIVEYDGVVCGYD